MAKNEFPPVEVVQVPRKVFTPAIWNLPYSELRELAERGERGTSVFQVRNLARGANGLTYQQHVEDKVLFVNIEPNVALMRQGADIIDGSKDRAFLYGQNW